MKFFIAFLFLNFLVYLIGAFIAWNLDPTSWWIISAPAGRIVTLIIEFILVKALVESDALK